MRALLLIVLSLAGVFSSSGTTPLIPATYYPRGSHITVHPSLSNKQMDCMWGFFCEGPVPLFHFHTQAQLHRSSGWAQLASSGTGKTYIAFELFASRYSTGTNGKGTAWSEVAYDDFAAATRHHGYHPLSTGLVGQMPRGAAFQAFQEDAGDVYFRSLAVRSGLTEIEGVVMYAHDLTSKSVTLLHILASQERLALRKEAASNQSK